MKDADWLQVIYIIAHNGVFVSTMQFIPIKLQVHAYLSDLNYFWSGQTVLKLYSKYCEQAPPTL